MFFVFYAADTALTAVSRDILAVSGETVDRQQTVVGTTLTSCKFGIKS